MNLRMSESAAATRDATSICWSCRVTCRPPTERPEVLAFEVPAAILRMWPARRLIRPIRLAGPPVWAMKKHGYQGPRQSHGAGFGGFRNAKRFGGGEHEGVRGAKGAKIVPRRAVRTSAQRTSPK